MKLILFCFPALLILLGCSSGKEDMSEMPLYEGPDVEIKDVVTLFSDSAKVKIKLQAKTQLEYQKSGDRIFPDGVYIEFYDVDGTISSTLSANYGEYLASEKVYRGEGNVVVISRVNGDELNTEELFWNPDKKEIYTEKFVTIKSEGEIHTGEGMTASQDFTTYTISKPTGTLTIDEPL